jgi:hypothetical protein
MFKPEDILTSQGKYPDRASHRECTELVKENSEELAKRVNALLDDFFKLWMSSGFRTSSSNASTPGAAPQSNHKKGVALDLMTLGFFLKKDYQENVKKGTPEKSLLVKHDLYLEDPEYTKDWTHLQFIPPRSGNRVFIPK